MGKCLVAPVGETDLPHVVGSYQGKQYANGAYERIFELGFCPSLVLVLSSREGAVSVQNWDFTHVAIAIRGMDWKRWDGVECLRIEEYGFRIFGTRYYEWNKENSVYYYIAFR